MSGKFTSNNLPFSILQELAILITPPEAITFLSVYSKNGFTILCKESSNNKQSTSIHAKYLLSLMLMPQFSASAFPPFSLSTTINFSNAGFLDLKTPALNGLVGTF